MNRSYRVQLVFVENEEFEVPSRFNDFPIEAVNIVDAVIKLDTKLYDGGVTGHANDFSDDYNQEETYGKVSFSDGESGLMLTFSIEER